MAERRKVGLALGGGVVRGSAHLGVLSALTEAGIPIDLVSGASSGAIAALCYCSGMDSAGLLRFARRMSWPRLMRPVWPLRGLVSFNGLAGLIAREIGDLAFEDLPLPCVVVVSDLESGQPRYLDSGRVIPAVQASCCVPGFVAPVRIDGRWMGEGGMTDMLPAAVLRRMGADYVIGVDIFQPRLRRLLGPLGYLLAGLETALERSGGGVEQVDCLVSPDLAGRPYLFFSQRERYIELGRQAALACLPQIRSALGLPAGPAGAPALPGVGAARGG